MAWTEYVGHLTEVFGHCGILQQAERKGGGKIPTGLIPGSTGGPEGDGTGLATSNPMRKRGGHGGGGGALLLPLVPEKMAAVPHELTSEPTQDAMFRLLVEQVSDLVCVVEMDGRLRYISQSVGVTGWTPADLVGRRIEEFMHPEDAKRSRRHLQEAGQREGATGSAEFRIRYRDGSYHRYELSGNNLTDHPAVRGIVCIGRNLGERRGRAERERLKLASLVESSTNFIALAHPGDTYTCSYINNAGLALAGLAESHTATGDSILKFMPEALREMVRTVVLPTVLRAGSWAGELAILDRRTGAEVPVLCNAFIIQAPGRQEPVAIALVARDITDRKRAEEGAHQRERYAGKLLANGQERCLVLNTDGTVKYISPLLEGEAGDVAEERVGLDAFKDVHPDDLARVKEAFARGIRESDRSHVIEFRLRRTDGSWRTMEAIGRNMLADPDVAGVVINYRDIMERKQAEEELRQAGERVRQSQKLEAVGRLAAEMAHWFKNKLYVINGYSESVLKRLPPGDALREDVEEIRKAGEAAAEITLQLLAFGRVQALHPVALDLNAILADRMKLLRDFMGAINELRLVPGSGLPPIRADRERLDQVIMNLVGNAKDAMPAGGTLTLATATVSGEPAGLPPGPWVRLVVADTGVGMDPEALSHAFEPFWTTKPTGKGTGLGLSTVYGIVEQSGGHVRVTSEPGRGTRFEVYLPPAEPEAADRHAGVSATAAPAGRETILVVEDEEDVRRLTRKTLAGHGYTVLEAGDGVDALAVLERETRPIHLLLTDVRMPRMDGRELATRARRLRPGLRIVFISAYPDALIGQHGELPPATVLLNKTISQDLLAVKIREVLDGG